MIPRTYLTRTRPCIIARNQSRFFAKQVQQGEQSTQQIQFNKCSAAELLDIPSKHISRNFKSKDFGNWWTQMSKHYYQNPRRFSIDKNKFDGPRDILLNKVPRLLSCDLAKITAALVKMTPLLSNGDITLQRDIKWGNLMNALAERTVETLPFFRPTYASSVLHAHAKNRTDQLRLFEAFEKYISEKGEQDKLGDFSSQSLSNIVWAYATSGYAAPELFGLLEKDIMEQNRLQEFAPQGLANLAWSYAKLSKGSPQFFDSIANNFLQRDLSEFSIQGMANIAWALVRSSSSSTENETQTIGGISIKKVLSTTVAEIIDNRNVSEFSPQSISNIYWSCATSSYRNDALSELVESLVKEFGFSSFNEQEVSILLWSFAKSGRIPSKHFLDSLENELLINHRIQHFSPEEISIMMLAYGMFGTEGRYHHNVPIALMNEIVSRGTAHLETRVITGSIQAAAKMGIFDHGLFDAAAEDFKQRKEFYPMSNLADLLFGFAEVNYEDIKSKSGSSSGSGDLYEQVIEHIKSQTSSSFTKKTMTRLLWSFSVLNIKVEPFFGFEEWINNCENIPWDTTDMSQLYQFYLNNECASNGKTDQLFAVKCLDAVKQRHKEILNEQRMSKIQQDVGLVLSSMENIHVVGGEVFLEDAGYSVDYLVTFSLQEEKEDIISDQNEKLTESKNSEGRKVVKVAIEVDGPSHFLVGGIPNGSTLMKRRHLISKGYKFVSVPFWQWKTLDSFSKEPIDYLSKLIFDDSSS